MNYQKCIAKELSLSEINVENVIKLLSSDATVPFISRYRKEATGGLNEISIRAIDERYTYLKELKIRKDAILKSIEEQGKLNASLKKTIDETLEKSKLEDLYLPYKQKRKTRASIAQERGLLPLLNWILLQRNPNADINKEAQRFLNKEKEINTFEDALNGASDIYAQMISENAKVRDFVRGWFNNKGVFISKVKKSFKDKKTKFEMYYKYSCPVRDISSHNMLALRRAEKEGILTFDINVETDEIISSICKSEINLSQGLLHEFLKNAIFDSYNRLIKNSIIAEVRLNKKKEAEIEAISTFEKNLKHLLLSSPAGNVNVLAIDPGFRNGCKVSAISGTGKFLEYTAIFPHTSGQKKEEEAKDSIIKLINKHKPEYIAIGNGTASRETERFVKNTLKKLKSEKNPKVLLVNESGASIYSASDSAIKEFPDLDVLVRGAISIGRRLIDPLSELVKIDPKSIGVGQYQHDVDQKLLKSKLEDVVESCVNFVGVDLNSASMELLSYVSGITPQIAKNIILYKNEIGTFKNRKELLKVKKLGAKTYEQASGFLRIKGGNNLLDNSAVHPESYYIVDNITKVMNVKLEELIGSNELINKIKPTELVNESAGVATIKDIIEELKKPGRDPRTKFTYASFNDDISEIKDLKEGMVLEGIITNVANFGAFVDIGVHSDGLVHISQMADSFVKDPHKIVKVGQNVLVQVTKVDEELKRISLSMRKN